MAGIFISYARADDEAFVERLHRDLVQAGLDVWWDREVMESRGRTFMQEIQDAISSAERVVLVVGPRASRSEYVRAEWEFALECCKVVVPILRQGDDSMVPVPSPDVAHAVVPESLSAFHCPDFRSDRDYPRALEELTRILAAPVPPLATPNGVPEFPLNYVPRPDLLERLQQNVLGDLYAPSGVKRGSRVAALTGMVGAGKSVLGAAFARACATRRAMGDGVIWLRFGREASLLANLRQCAELVGASAQSIRDESTAVSRIAGQLADKSCLIVLDDVSELHQVTVFRDALGPRSRLLITTRDHKVAAAVSPAALHVDALDDAGALELLARWSGRKLDHLPAAAHAIARECGNLPLAIAMIGATLRGNPRYWQNALHKLRNADLEGISGELPGYDHPNLLRAMEVSVSALKPRTRARYLDFAVFPEDAAIPASVFAALWQPEGLDPYQAEDILNELVERSLARRDAEGRISIHDLQLDYVRARTRNREALHQRLIEGYQQRHGGDWSQGPNDGYFLQNLSHHLIESGRCSELITLLTESPAWMRAKLRALGSHQSLLTDIDRAARHTTDLLAHVQFAAIRSVAQSETESYGEPALRALVLLGRGGEALANARVSALPMARFNALRIVYDALLKRGDSVDALRDELWRAARHIPVHEDRAHALTQIGALFSRDGDRRVAQPFAQARLAAIAIPDVWVRARRLCELAAAMNDRLAMTRADILDEAWDAALPHLANLEITDAQVRLALAFAAAGQFDRAETVAASIGSSDEHAGGDPIKIYGGMVVIGPQATWKDDARALLAKAYAEAGLIEEAQRRAAEDERTGQVANPRIALALINAGRFAEARETIRRISTLSEQAHLLRALGLALRLAGKRGAPAAFRDSWQAAERIESLGPRVSAFCQLAQVMAVTGDRRATRAMVQAFHCISGDTEAQPGERAAAISEVVGGLALLGHFDEALPLAENIADTGWRAHAMAVLAGDMARAGDGRAETVLDQSIASAAGTRDDSSWYSNLQSLSGLLIRYRRYAAALAISRAIMDGWVRIDALTDLGLALARAGNEHAGAVLGEALDIIPWGAYAPDVAERARKIVAALVLAGDQRANSAITQAAQVARKGEGSCHTPRLLAELAGSLSAAGHRRADVLTAHAERLARRVKTLRDRITALTDLALQLHLGGRPRGRVLLREAQRALLTQRGVVRDEGAARQLTKALTEAGLLDEARRVISGVRRGDSRADAEAVLADGLIRRKRWDEARTLALEITSLPTKADTLIDLAAAMARDRAARTGDILDAALEAVHAMDPSPLRTRLQSNLVLPLVLEHDDRAETLLREAMAGDPEGANWTGIHAAALVEAGQIAAALDRYLPSNSEMFLHTLICWAGPLDHVTAGLGLAAVTEAARIVGWIRPDWREVHARVLAVESETPPDSDGFVSGDSVARRNHDTAIFPK